MVLLGSGTRTRTQSSGTFSCPREGGNRRYRLVAVRRWLCAGRLAVLPRAEIARFVECRSCRSTFVADVLTLEPGDTRTEDVLTLALRRTVPTVLGAPADLSAVERREAVIVLQRYANVPYGSRDLDTDLAEGLQTPDDTFQTLAISLNDQGRVAVLAGAVQLAVTHGSLDPRRIRALENVASALSLPVDAVSDAVGRRYVSAGSAGSSSCNTSRRSSSMSAT